MSGNRISLIRNSLSSLQKLKAIKLSRNNISNSKELLNLTKNISLVHLSIEDNPVMQMKEIFNFCINNIKTLKILNNRKVLRAHKRFESFSFISNNTSSTNKSFILQNRATSNVKKNLRTSLASDKKMLGESLSGEVGKLIKEIHRIEADKMRRSIEELREVIEIKDEHLDLISTQMKTTESCSSDIDEFNIEEKEQSSKELAMLKKELVQKELEYNNYLRQSMNNHTKNLSLSHNSELYPDNSLENTIKIHKEEYENLQKKNNLMREELKTYQNIDKAFINNTVQKVISLHNYMADNLNQRRVHITPNTTKEQWEVIGELTKVTKEYIKTMERSLCNTKDENTVKVVLYGDSSVKSKCRVGKVFKSVENKEKLIDMIAENIITEVKEKCNIKTKQCSLRYVI